WRTRGAVTGGGGGRLRLRVAAAPSALPRVQSGQIRLLAISSPSRYPLMPDAPLIVDTVPGIEFMSWLGLAMAPATPREIVDRVNQEIRTALTSPDVQQRLVEGGNVATPSTPEAMRPKVEGDMVRWSRVIEAAGIKTE